MAQIGSFVPARKAKLPVFDRIFTRIGASDDLLQGKSTFMTEMMEANNALRHATKNSLILFDEIGRRYRHVRWHGACPGDAGISQRRPSARKRCFPPIITN